MDVEHMIWITVPFMDVELGQHPVTKGGGGLITRGLRQRVHWNLPDWKHPT